MKFRDRERFFDYFFNLKKKGIKLDLAAFSSMLRKFGNPHLKFPSIHIAGTNGKGSTAHMTAALLRSMGYKTGLFTSPHVESFNERISVDGKNISYEEIVRYAESFENKISPSFFEAATIMAFLKFAGENVDVAVIETGLGGRLDTTNLVDPAVTVITSVSSDHALMLTSDLRNVAWEKAGIAKSGVPLIVPELPGDILRVVVETAKARGAEVLLHGKDVIYESRGEDGILWYGKDGSPLNVKVPLKGKKQHSNTASALKAVELFSGKKLTQSLTDKAFDGFSLPCRMETIRNFVLDGAHNPEAIHNLTETFKSAGKTDFQTVIAMMEDKNIDFAIKKLLEITKGFHCTTVGDARSLSPDALSDKIEKSGGVVLSKNKTPAQLAGELDKTSEILVTGSFYLVGEFRKNLLNSNGDSLSLTDPAQ